MGSFYHHSLIWRLMHGCFITHTSGAASKRDCGPGQDGGGSQRSDAVDDEECLGADAQQRDGCSSGPPNVACGGWRGAACAVARERAIAGGEPGPALAAEPTQRTFAENGARRAGRTD